MGRTRRRQRYNRDAWIALHILLDAYCNGGHPRHNLLPATVSCYKCIVMTSADQEPSANIHLQIRDC